MSGCWPKPGHDAPQEVLGEHRQHGGGAAARYHKQVVDRSFLALFRSRVLTPAARLPQKRAARGMLGGSTTCALASVLVHSLAPVRGGEVSCGPSGRATSGVQCGADSAHAPRTCRGYRRLELAWHVWRAASQVGRTFPSPTAGRRSIMEGPLTRRHPSRMASASGHNRRRTLALQTHRLAART